ncbi:MAG: tetratricopeptide repeat protein [Flavobacteriales bacterium]|jgi:Ca-activated chloride channel family protein|nr:tetratricopeptide repeat protein [Flavobacteriales bacterium]
MRKEDDMNDILIYFSSEKFSKALLLLCSLIAFTGNTAYAQLNEEQTEAIQEANVYLSEATAALNQDKFPSAEAEYRKAIALNPVDETGKYNLGTAYYGKEKNAEAMKRFLQAAEVAEAKPQKHKAFHNLGNTFMNEKKYQEAVEAYKNALRNDPTDDETRYNLALAKKLLEEEQKNGGGDDGDKEQNKDNKDDKQDQDDQGKDQEGDKGDEKENKDQGDQKDENKEGENKKDQGKPEDQKDGKGEEKPQQQQPVPGKLSPQQVKSLLEAMNNEEKKVQDKINAQKTKGAKVKSNKDW